MRKRDEKWGKKKSQIWQNMVRNRNSRGQPVTTSGRARGNGIIKFGLVGDDGAVLPDDNGRIRFFKN